MNKRGQLAPIVIVALVLIVVIGLVVFFNNQSEIKVDPEVQPIYDYVNECIKQVSEEGIYYLGQTGGYFDLVGEAYQESIAYYFYEGKNYAPSREKIEVELSNYINHLTEFCVSDFERFSDFEIDGGKVNSNVQIEDEIVEVNVDYNVGIKKGENSYSFNKFKLEVPSRLGTIHSAIEELMVEQMKRKDGVCLNCLYELGEKNELYFNLLDTEIENNLMIVVRDEKVKILDDEYVFYYAVKLEESK